MICRLCLGEIVVEIREVSALIPAGAIDMRHNLADYMHDTHIVMKMLCGCGACAHREAEAMARHYGAKVGQR